ncbi:3-hydroxyacyl-ACP dehydratase FabZ [Serratia sp. M24T3]|uniref:3-hydroxyacyl-ACP dehydratase FabZ n=1 Tax=Serratia sp. M24T3 TaxID=932213 RepID=UPI00025BAE31|nr:3-hydroxyacyl-ACP dehydratase FabZ [Serratia sp. M24T3]EIC83404.1 3-hydroxyacyl-ACP dehydratase [Serratia sp. M24T3]
MGIHELPLRPEDIAQILPHRYPFLLIDRVISTRGELAEGRVQTLKNISANDGMVQDGSLTGGTLPSVLILEAMAQAAGVLAHYCLLPMDNGQLCYFASIERARFYGTVSPGDPLLLDVHLRRQRRNMVCFSGMATVSGTRICTADFMCARS